MARRAKKVKATDGGEATGTEALRGNGFDSEIVTSLVDRILNLHGDLSAARIDYMNECKPIHQDINAVLDEGRDKGIPRKALKAAVKKKLLERKIDNIRDDMEGDDLDNYDLVLKALGDLADTPLGRAATKNGNGADAHA